MTSATWVTLGQAIVMALVGLLVFSIRGSFKAGQWTESKDYSKDIAAINGRLDQAGRQMSDIASEVQAWPERMREDFMTRREIETHLTYSQQQRSQQAQDIERIWQELNLRRKAR
jgi:hypothetical protein